MQVYDEEYTSQGFTFRAGKLTTKSVLGICLNLQDEQIVDLINHDPETLAECLREIMPEVIFSQAHYKMHWIADENGVREEYFSQWEDYFRSCNFNKLSRLKMQAELVLNNPDRCSPRAKNNAIIVLECLRGNYPPVHHKEKTPEEKAKYLYEKRKPKLRIKLVIRDGYKCDNCGKDKEDSLCVIQKEVHNTNYELDNLILRCRSCMNKLKKK